MERETPSLEDRLAEARRRSLDATRAAYEAQEALTHLELDAATERARAKLEGALAQGALSPELHGELVCDAARDHGATCARAKSISEVSWRAVRVAVANIVDRLASAERGRDMAQAAERTFALRLRLVHEVLGDPECEVVLASDLVARRIHEAQEQGARWMLEAYSRTAGIGEPSEVRANIAARICAEARAKGGDHG